nr:hypothetical protein CFP56_05718 [Quercus suber]
MADTDSDHDSGMAESDSDEYDSEVELEIATAYVQLCIEYMQKYYMKRPMCTSILSGRHLCNELKRLHLLEEDTSIVSVDEAFATVLFIVGHNADYQLTANRFQHSLKTIQRRFRRALRAIHALGCLIIRPDADATELPHSLRGNEKYYPWFELDFVILTFESILDEMFQVWEGSFVRNSDANPTGAARVGSRGDEKAFNSRAQRAMSKYRDAITAAMWVDYIGNRD